MDWQIVDPQIALYFAIPRQLVASLSKTTLKRVRAVLSSSSCSSALRCSPSSSGDMSSAGDRTSMSSAGGITSFNLAQLRRSATVVQQQFDQHCEADEQPHVPPWHGYA